MRLRVELIGTMSDESLCCLVFSAGMTLGGSGHIHELTSPGQVSMLQLSLALKSLISSGGPLSVPLPNVRPSFCLHTHLSSNSTFSVK